MGRSCKNHPTLPPLTGVACAFMFLYATLFATDVACKHQLPSSNHVDAPQVSVKMATGLSHVVVIYSWNSATAMQDRVYKPGPCFEALTG